VRAHPIIPVGDPLRSFCVYAKGAEPYREEDHLAQKLWSIVNFEFGPNVADVLVTKLQCAVEAHVSRAVSR
jgi:hypothetical protein